MLSVSVVPANELDLDEYVGLQVDAYKAHLGKYGVDPGFMNSVLYAWKYSPPAGVGKLAIARDDTSLLAAVAVLPLWIECDGRRCLLWRAVDIATLPSARGKGLFKKLLLALRDDLGADEVLGSFPNSNSTPGFKKIGAGDAAYAPTWVRLVPPGLRRGRGALAGLETFASDRAETLRRLTVRPGVSSFLRDVDYLNWRYSRHPDHSYHISLVDDGSGDSGLIVFRETETYGRRMVIVLEWWASSAGSAMRVLRAATDYCREHRVRYMVTVSNTFGVLHGLRAGFLRVPRSLAPKEQVLRGVARGEAANEVFFNEWSLQMGDLLEF
jgi:GNAT superfamily N-acetyltransferase